MPTLEDFGRELLEELHDVHADTDLSAGLFALALEVLAEEGDQEEPKVCTFRREDNFTGELLMRLDGYDLDGDDEAPVIDLFATLNVTDEPARPLPAPAINDAMRQLRRFVVAARLEGLQDDPALDSEIRDLARAVRETRRLAEIRLNVITNGVVRDFDRSVETVDGLPVRRRVLDLHALRRLRYPEEIDVEFSVSDRAGLPCVQLPADGGVYRSYLAVVPGAFLADLYGRYSQRLLEANVRSFLRASGKVNRGILHTIREEPHMFFAYNNGITATASEIAVERAAEGGLVLVRCRNLQIVNGGQTTASLHLARRRRIPLDTIHVAMKISEVLDESRAFDIVQQISVNANSQNKVNFSDLGANHPFHVRLQALAEREFPAPLSPESEPRSGWFYERMRGQYQQRLALLTPAKKRDEIRRFPKSQVFRKTDVARYMMTWEQRPFCVSLGSEKNYKKFLDHAQENGWLAESCPVPDVRWFHELIAKAILVETCDRLVIRSRIPGYKANIVAYTVALLAHRHGGEVDLERIWQDQAAGAAIEAWLEATIPVVRDHINRTPTEGMNVGEWTKKEDCWRRLVDLPFETPRLFP